VVLDVQHNGQQCRNILHFVRDTGTAAVSLVSLGEAVISKWTNNIRSHVAIPTQLESVGVYDLTDPGAGGIDVIPSSGFSGVAAGPPMPGNVTAVISLKTGRRGRSFRGRIYHIGLTETQVEGNTLATGVAAQLQIAYQTLVFTTPTTGPAMRLAVLSYYTNSTVRPEGIATPVTGTTVNNEIDSQRRRLAGRGN
jgi:hypothetical protein